MADKQQVPAIEGWFTSDPVEPHLVGSRCNVCGRIFFPARASMCGLRGCAGESVPYELSRRGRVWSVTDNRYPPPEPFVTPAGGFVPYTVAAVEAAAERMVVLGQMVPGVGPGDVKVGDEVELVVDTLYETDDTEYTVWKWKPVGTATEVSA